MVLSKMNGDIHDVEVDQSSIVISGISGRFPKSDNMSEFASNLYNKVDMIDDAEDRYKHIYGSHPKRFGKIRNLEKFDASFFSILPKHANINDPQGRILVEAAYEAILDAGVCPKSLVDSYTGVYVGCFNFDSYENWLFDKDVIDSVIGGNAFFSLANRLSFCLGLKGPSFGLDSACSSSLYALDLAVKAMRNGDCDSALVAGTNLILNPLVTNDLNKAGILASNGIARPFDESASGYVRADAICVVFLQKAENAKRVYSTVVHCKTNNDGFKKEGTTFPSWQVQKDLFMRVYNEIKMDPVNVDYIEAHATGTAVGDPQEAQSIDEVFCKNRKKPLPIGSLKSNIGHAEGAAGICSVAKSILIFENEKLIPNINLTKVRSDCASLAEGRLRIIDEVEDFTGSLIAVNSFGVFGANAHALLKRNEKPKVNQGIPEDDLPRLLLWSGRTEDALSSIFDDIIKRPLDAELIGLLQSTQTETNQLNIYRGYGIFKKSIEGDRRSLCVEKDIYHFNDSKRPIVWVFSGVGSQWCGMGKELMKIPVIGQAIEMCHDILASRGINLKEILTSSDESIFNNILNTFVGVAAIQIGLTDVLKTLGLKPDYIIGHSVGELGCAYADGCLTAEEMILSAYSRGKAINDVARDVGAMAAIGMGYNELKGIVPNGIEIACHNSSDSCTVSGSVDKIRSFVKETKAKKTLAKEIQSSGIPFHSSYIASSGPILLKSLKSILKHKVKRSSKWISTSVAQDKKDDPENQYSSPLYHTNNLLNPVLFEEGLALLPKDALVIEIAPHSLLQPILQKALSGSIYVSLTKRNSEDGSLLLLSSIGRLFQQGVDCDVSKLYPAVKFPVSRGTPMIAPIIKWNHSENYVVPLYDSFKRCDKRNVRISLSDPKYEYIQGHTLDGRILFPATAYLCLVWETFAMMMGTRQDKIAVIFEDIRLSRATALTKEQDVEMTIMIQRGSGRFEIVEGGAELISGCIKVADNEKSANVEKPCLGFPQLDKKDFYKELRLRGYQYFDKFKRVQSATIGSGKIIWDSNWVTFTDCMLQFSILHNESRGLCLPTSIRKIVIDPVKHLHIANQQTSDEKVIDVIFDTDLRVIKSGGIEIYDLEASFVNRRPLAYDPVLEANKFIPHMPTSQLSMIDMAKFCTQLALENCIIKKVTLVESDDDRTPFCDYFYSALGDLPLITAELHYLSKKELDLSGATVHDEPLNSFSNVNIFIKSNCFAEIEVLKEACDILSDTGYILSRETKHLKKDQIKLPDNCQIIACVTLEDENVYMVQCIRAAQEFKPTVVEIPASLDSFNWIEDLKKAVVNGQTLVYSKTTSDNVSGILGLVNCIRREPGGFKNIRCVFVDQEKAPAFDLKNPFYMSQLNLGLAMNIYKNNKWGSYKHLSMGHVYTPEPTKDHVFASCVNRGDLSSLTWLNGSLNVDNPKNKIIEVHYSALNFRDVMLATGRISLDSEYGNRINQQYVFGFEFSGVTENGSRIMGMVSSKALSSHIDPVESLMINVPDNWSLEEAATVPLVYFTVYTAFFFSTNIKAGKKILIHAGSGGVGLAAIRVAIAYGLEVFTTVSSKEKTEFLLNEFPKLKSENIGNSRDTTFEEMVLKRTKGKGVDYVLNSLSEEKLQASIRCLADNGYLLEIGKFDMLNKSKIHLGHFMRGITFKSILCHQSELLRNWEQTMSISNMIENDMKNGIIKPLKTTVFEACEIEKAFRYLAAGKHMGKVLLKVRPNEKSKETLPISVLPRFYCNPEHSYIIPGGLGGFGLELADWLVLRECQKLVLSSSRGITNSYQAYRIKMFESYGVKVKVNTSDIASKNGCEELIKDAMTMGPVGGIFNLAVILKDGILENQTEAMFRESLGPKATATKYLDEISRKLCPELKHFVVFSSVSCGRGNAGQSNYGMANSVMERIIENRVRDGLPGKAIQWGAIGEVGLVANMQESNIELEIGGTLQQRISSCLQVMDSLLACSTAIISSMVVAEKRYDTKGGKNILETITRIMGIKDIKSISMDSSLADLGMDSLMGVEIHQILERDFDCILTSEEMRTITINELQKKVSDINNSDLVAELDENNDPDYLDLVMNDFGDSLNNINTILPLNDVKDNKLNKILIVPGMEGLAGKTWMTLAKGIVNPTYALQLLKESHLKDFEDTFDAIIGDVLNLFQDDEKFLIVGYSFGSMMALKIAGKLELLGKKGKLIVIDGSPKFMKTQSAKYIPIHFKDADIQNLLLAGVANKVYGIESEKIIKNVMAQTSWELKLKELQRIYFEINENAHFEHVTASLNAAFNRIKTMMIADQLNFPVLQNTPLYLIKPSISSIKIDDDYDLQKYSQKEIEIQTIDGNHLSILENSKLTDAINSLASLF